MTIKEDFMLQAHADLAFKPADALLPVLHQPPKALAVPSDRAAGPSLNELCARQKPPALLQSLHERARWFHEYQTSSSFLLSLETRGGQRADCA